MKRFSLLIICFLATYTFAQEQPETNYIEINAEVEKEVTPDEIYIFIGVEERFDGKDKITLQQQESNLKKDLKAKGINLEELKLWDAMSQYQQVKWYGKKDALASSNYSLKVSNAAEVTKVFEVLAKLQIEKARIYKTDYSGRLEIKKELRIAAMKKGKDQADYMLGAIGEKTGKPMIVRENNYYVRPMMSFNKMATNELAYDQQIGMEEDATTEFNSIKYSISLYLKFEIAE